MVNLHFRVATESDHNEVLHFLREHYYAEEPITIGYYAFKHQTSADEEFTMSNLKYGTTILCLDDTDRLVGVLVSGPIVADEEAITLEEANSTTDQKWSDILRLLGQLEKESDVCGRYDVSKSLHVHVLGVHLNVRGHSIGLKLIEECMNVGRCAGYQLMSIDCTSVHSIRLAEKLHFDWINTLAFEDYKDDKGIQVFQPPSPHKHIKSYAKRL